MNQKDKVYESNIFLANIYGRLFKDGIELINNANYILEDYIICHHFKYLLIRFVGKKSKKQE